MWSIPWNSAGLDRRGDRLKEAGALVPCAGAVAVEGAIGRSGGTIDLGPASGRENLGGTLGRLGQERPGTGQPGAVDEMLSPGRKTGG